MNYYKEIKNEIINNEVTKRIKDYSKNKSDLESKYRIGKLLSEAGKHYGEGIIKEYSKRLINDLGKKYSVTTLKYIRQFYVFSKSHSLSDQLSYTHYKTLLPIKDDNKINYYIKISIEQHLSVNELKDRIKNNEYDRLTDKTKYKLINSEQLKVEDLVPNPILIKNNLLNEKVSEYALKQLILNNMDDFLSQLGTGFTYAANEYKIKVDNTYNYIDLLLFNYEYNCFIVVELKVTDLKKEHIGQIQVYMNYIDENLRKPSQNITIGIIICREDNEYVIKYCSDDRIISREYKLV